MNMYMVHMKVQLKFACVQMCRGYIRMTEIPLKCKGHKIVWREGTSVSLFQRLDLTDPLVQRQSTHELKGLIRESNQKFKIENLRGGKATSSKLGGSTSKSHFLRLLPTSGRKSGHDPQHWPLLDQHALQAATASQLSEHIRLAESCCCVFTAPLGQIFETTSKVTETHWTGGCLCRWEPCCGKPWQTILWKSQRVPKIKQDLVCSPRTAQCVEQAIGEGLVRWDFGKTAKKHEMRLSDLVTRLLGCDLATPDAKPKAERHVSVEWVATAPMATEAFVTARGCNSQREKNWVVLRRFGGGAKPQMHHSYR